MSLPEDQSHLDSVRRQLESAMSELGALMGRDGAGEGTNEPSPSRLAKHTHFKIFRDYIEHEDDLINGRLLWIINIQGFLFATYGFSVQKLAEIQNIPNDTKPLSGQGLVALVWLIRTLPVLGVLISIFSLIGVFAAQTAIAQLTCDWAEAETEHLLGAKARADGPLLPGIIGGGDRGRGEKTWKELNRRAHKLGFLGPIMFPVIFIAAWLMLLASYFGFSIP